MNKLIKTTVTNVIVQVSSIMVVQISDLIFEFDEMYPWINVYQIKNSDKKLVAEIDKLDMPIFNNSEDGYEELKIYCLNWYFNNVEIVKSKNVKFDE